MTLRIHELCGDCKHFEHECESYGDDSGCLETCNSTNQDVKDYFYEFDYEEITKCEGFEKS